MMFSMCYVKTVLSLTRNFKRGVVIHENKKLKDNA